MSTSARICSRTQALGSKGSPRSLARSEVSEIPCKEAPRLASMMAGEERSRLDEPGQWRRSCGTLKAVSAGSGRTIGWQRSPGSAIRCARGATPPVDGRSPKPNSAILETPASDPWPEPRRRNARAYCPAAPRRRAPQHPARNGVEAQHYGKAMFSRSRHRASS